jgi:hypothetical protein
LVVELFSECFKFRAIHTEMIDYWTANYCIKHNSWVDCFECQFIWSRISRVSFRDMRGIMN